MNIHNRQEKEIRQKKMRTSLGIHLGILALAFFIGCPQNQAEDKEYEIAVNFQQIDFTFDKASNSTKSESTAGAKREKQEPVQEVPKPEIKEVEIPKPEVKQPEIVKTPPKPTTPIISETTIEEPEPEVVAVEEEIEIEEPEPEVVPDKPKPAAKRVEEASKPSKSTSKPSTSSSEKPSTDTGKPSKTEGTKEGTGKADSGTGKGKDAKGDDDDSGIGSGGAGEGDYDDSGNGVFGRRVIYRNIKALMDVGFENQKGSKIVAKFCVARPGNVTFVEIMDETTAIITRAKMKAVMDALYGYKVEPDWKAPREQCGKITISIDVNALWGG